MHVLVADVSQSRLLAVVRRDVRNYRDDAGRVNGEAK
jgi:hypothetical protein